MCAGKRAYVTGATGFVGSHLVERLAGEGWRVKALVRPSSDVSLLKTLGVALVPGDVTDATDALRAGLADATHVFHCAAYVSDWGERERMRAVNVEGLRHVLEAVPAETLERFVFLGSCVVYGGGDQCELDESAPFVETGDGYNMTKIACERLLRTFARERNLATVSLRAPYVYGPRDRHFLPSVIAALEDGSWKYLDGGRRPFTLVHVSNVVDACVLAATCDDATGQGFIITDGESITRRELVDILCEELGVDPPSGSVPRWLAKALCPVYEGLARLFGAKRAPRINRFRLKFASAHMTFDVSKARRVLGCAPKHATREGLREAARWFRDNRPDLIGDN